MTQPFADLADEATLRAFLEALDRECSAYCLLGGYEGLAAEVHSDIDFMVGKRDFDRLPQILSRLAGDVGFRLVQNMQHETTACYYILARQRPGQILFFHPDACSDYRRANRTWLRPEAVLARRRMHPEGFWIPAAADGFQYYLIKRIDKLCLEERHAQQLSRLFSKDEQGCREALKQRLSAASAQLVAEAAHSGNWQPVVEAIQELDKELLATASADSLRTQLGELKRMIRRVIQPAGLCVAVLGAEDDWKLSFIEQYRAALAMAFRRTANMHSQPSLLRGQAAGAAIDTGPHDRNSREALPSAAKLLLSWADSVLGYYLRVRPLLVRSTLVVCDGYSQDLLIDARGIGGPRRLARLIAMLMPMPDLMLILDAPPGALSARRQVEPYRSLADLAALRGRAILVDATRPLEHVVDECTERTLAFLAERMAKRLHLE